MTTITENKKSTFWFYFQKRFFCWDNFNTMKYRVTNKFTIKAHVDLKNNSLMDSSHQKYMCG
jgi:hypothetical protein